MTDKRDKLQINTQLVHAGERQPLDQVNPVATPIYSTVTFTYGSMEEIDQVFSGEKSGFIYTRYGNPTIAGLEEAVRTIEEGATASAYSTGMAALHAALFACDLKPGSIVVASQDLYGATTALLTNIFGGFGVKSIFVDFSDLDSLKRTVEQNRPQVLVAETISNPLLKVCDIEACAEIAHQSGARFVVDNTFASPYLCQPLKYGADLVVHSATKYLSGHADAMGGLVVSRDEMDKMALVSVMKLAGGVLGVWEAHQIMRGLKTLGLRMERQCNNARTLAAELAKNELVGRVFYPDPEVDRGTRLLRQGFMCALVTIELKQNTRVAAFAVMDALKLCVRSTSLGDVFTSVLHPATASHRDLTPDRRRDLGISDGLMRISVGIEGVDDLLADIEQALKVGNRSNES